jgi:sterol desaturase/sphingolipid hydroxylase (fatty acid hydroxylase superfamily)
MPVSSVVVFELLLTLTGIFHHSNLPIPNWTNRLFSKTIVMPFRHYVHHHAIPEDTNSNYGFIFICWDYMFNTINFADRTPEWKIGLKYSCDKPLEKLIYYPFTNKYLRNL